MIKLSEIKQVESFSDYRKQKKRFDVEISEVKFIGRPKYLNSQMTRAKEKISFVLNGQKIERMADIRMIGNFSPAWVNVAGKSWQIDNYKLTRFEDVDTIA